MAPPMSYAEVTSRRGSHSPSPTDKSNPGPLAYSVDRRNSDQNSNTAFQRLSGITIEEPVFTTTRPPLLEQSSSSRASLSVHRPSTGPRRTSINSIAQVLSNQVLSRISSHVSESPSRESVVSDAPPALIQDDFVKSKKSRKRRKNKPKFARRPSSHTQNYGDFLASQGLAADTQPVIEETKPPLIIAIESEDVDRVRTLVENKTSIYDFALSSYRPLQVAALTGNEEIVRLLLESGCFDINARDSREGTALYAARSRGHDSIARLLLEHKAKDLSHEELRIALGELKQWRAYKAQTNFRAVFNQQQIIEGADVTTDPEHDSEDDGQPITRQNTVSRGATEDEEHIYNLEVGSCENIKEMEEYFNQQRRDAQKNGEWVAGPMPKPPNLSGAQREVLLQNKHARYPGFGFEIPIVEFDFSDTDKGGGHRVVSPTPTVDELLYGNKGIDSIVRGRTDRCRWYHLPANNLGWAEDLIRKIYERRSTTEQRKRDVILRREPFSSIDHDNINSTLLDPRPQARSLRPMCRNMTLDRDGTQRLSTALALSLPFIHWETEESRAEMHHVMEVVRQGRKDDIEGIIPKSIPNMKSIGDRSDWNKNEKLLTAYLYNSPPVHPRRTLDQFYYHMLENTERRDQDQVISRYYHNVWTRNHPDHKDENTNGSSMGRYKNPNFKFSLKPKINEPTFDVVNGDAKRLSEVSPHQSPVPLHETDYSPHSPGPRYRGSVHREKPQQEPHNNEKEEQHIIMVDQLWLWILDDNTILTSFPQNWTHDDDPQNREGDSMDVFASIRKYLTLVNRPPLESVYDLAQLIVYKCLATFCKKSTPYGSMQILDVYESAIASVTDEETEIFGEFASKSKKQHAYQQMSPESHESSEELYNISREIKQLKEIKDIQDELHILSVLLEYQTTVLHQAAEAMKKQETQNTPPKSPSLSFHTLHTKKSDGKMGQSAPYSSENHFGKLYNMVLEQEKRRKLLEVQAEQANNALNHLLDVKIKAANVSEARSARITAESTKQQGNIMVLFTLVTIIFAPLSLMSTIFSLRVVEFPQNLHMDYVIKYMFVVSIAVIVPLLGLVIYTTRNTIGQVLDRIKKRIDNWKWPMWSKNLRTKRKGKGRGRRGSAGSSHDEFEEGAMENEEEKKKSLIFWKRRGALSGNMADTEKGIDEKLS